MNSTRTAAGAKGVAPVPQAKEKINPTEPRSASRACSMSRERVEQDRDKRKKKVDRWMAEISYTDDRPSTEVAFEELGELHFIVEFGPNWNLIDQIVVTLNRPSVAPRKKSDSPSAL
jgi:hypothetical protein